ncbi:uncharacterized protein LOC141626624 isoform X3 [Silene latifolia]|uniref:uncharacterized protein LOC141626624 isoform X3 n=2 Tax=Silene latifolia TaxID=37657 RepID=UPI003D76D2F2
MSGCLCPCPMIYSEYTENKYVACSAAENLALNAKHRKEFTHFRGFGSMGVNGSSACVAGQSTTFSSRESRVKHKIKSFRVPELLIEMPETASISSFKEAFTCSKTGPSIRRQAGKKAGDLQLLRGYVGKRVLLPPNRRAGPIPRRFYATSNIKTRGILLYTLWGLVFLLWLVEIWHKIRHILVWHEPSVCLSIFLHFLKTNPSSLLLSLQMGR